MTSEIPPTLAAILTPHDPRHWPTWARLLRLLRSRVDSGIGDTAKRLLGPFGRWYERARPTCGCAARRELWNLRWPYVSAQL